MSERHRMSQFTQQWSDPAAPKPVPEKCDYCMANVATKRILDCREHEVAVCCGGCIWRYVRVVEDLRTGTRWTLTRAPQR